VTLFLVTAINLLSNTKQSGQSKTAIRQPLGCQL